MNKQEIIQQLKRLVALVEDIDSKLFHHNHAIDGYHLNGDMEPIMNFVADFDMEALTGAKEAIQSLTTPTSENTEAMREHAIGFAKSIAKHPDSDEYYKNVYKDYLTTLTK